MKKQGTIILLAIGHGLNDLVAGFFLGSLLLLKLDMLQVGLGLFVYNLLAFGGQYPVALWLEKQRNPRKSLLCACGLNVCAVALFALIPQLSIVITGMASAIYHVAGGTVCAKENKATNIGLFAAPGVVGLITGGYFAWSHLNISIELLTATLLFFLLLQRLPIADNKIAGTRERVEHTKFSIDQHDLIMIILLTVISLRSAVWNIFQLIHENNYEWLLAIALSAFIGKIAGGWLADRIGWRLYVFISLMAATPLITFFRHEIVLFCIGISLLQSGIPATTALLIQSVKGRTERAIGLSFGTAIIAGAVILYSPARNFLLSNSFLFGIIALMLLLMFLARNRQSAVGSRQLAVSSRQ